MRQNREVSYPILKFALTKEFGYLESEHDIILKISLRKQQYKESYDDFHSSIISMNLRLQSPLPDYTLLDIIKRNIQPNLRFLLFSSDSKSLNDFRDLARKAEKVLRDNKSFAPGAGQIRNVSEVNLIDNEISCPEIIDPQLKAFKFQRNNVKIDFSNIKCWNCLAYGHSYIYCGKEINKPFCFKCGQKGFLTPSCPNGHNFQGNQQTGEVVTGDTRPPDQSPSQN